MLEVNSDKSYTGKEIKEWCKHNPNDETAIEIMRRYYSDEVKYKPSDRIYYFIEYMTASQSYKECGSLNMEGARLIRDTDKSPRKYR